MSERITKEEREIAIRSYKRIDRICSELKILHDECDDLMYKYGWDLDTWEIAKAGMEIGHIGIGIGEAIMMDEGTVIEDDKEVKSCD